jgi:fibronectin-binding autotransporter adhesin
VGEWRYNGAARANTTFGKLVVNQGLYRLGDSGAGNNFETGFGAVPASFTADAITLNGGVLGTSYAETINTNRGLTLGAKGGTVAQTVASGTLTVPSVITGAGSFTIGNNAGTSASTTLTGVNTYTGPTAVAGSVSVASLANGGAASAIGMSTSAASNLVLDGGTLTYTGGAVSTDRLFSITSGGGTIANNGSGAIAFTNTGANPSTDKGVTNFTVTSGAVNLVLNSTTGTPFDLIGIAAGMGVSGTGIPAGDTVSSVSSTRAQFNLATAATATTANTPITFTDVNRTLTLAGSNAGANTIAGVLADSPTKALALTKSGAGTWVLSGANTYSGATTVSAGTLMAGAANTFPSVSAVSVSSGAILDLFGFSQVIGSLAGAGNVSLGGGKLTAGGSNGSTAHSGVISGAGGSLTKTGSGMLTLIGINTYTGGTTVSAGILAANTAVSGTNSATGTGPVIINNGAILAGTGAVGGTAGDVALNASVLNPGVANAGTLTALGNVTLNGGAGSNWIVGINSISSGPAANPLSLTNATGLLNIVTSSATYNIEFEAVSGPAFVQGTPVTYTIATAPAIQQSGLAFGNGTTGFTFSSTSIQFQNASLSVSGNNLQLTFTPVPEPAFVLLACGAASGAAGWWRRWRN